MNSDEKVCMVGAAVAVIALTVPATALASTASKPATTVEVNAAGSETNQISIRFDAVGLNYVINDSAGVTATAPCVQIDPNTATCPDGTVTALLVNAGNRNDRATLDAPRFRRRSRARST